MSITTAFSSFPLSPCSSQFFHAYGFFSHTKSLQLCSKGGLQASQGLPLGHASWPFPLILGFFSWAATAPCSTTPCVQMAHSALMWLAHTHFLPCGSLPSRNIWNWEDHLRGFRLWPLLQCLHFFNNSPPPETEAGLATCYLQKIPARKLRSLNFPISQQSPHSFFSPSARNSTGQEKGLQLSRSRYSG